MKFLHLIHAVLWLASVCASAAGAEPLNLAILTDTKPATANACEPLDLRILTESVSITARPVEALDLAILSDSPKSTKPAVKPAKQVEFGKEVGGQCKPVSATSVLDWAYPTRGAHWTHPGTIRQHVLEGVHAGKLTAEQVAAMTDAELEAWHSDDHEGKNRKPVRVERVADATPKPQPKRATLTSGGVTYYEHSDGVYRARKEDGCEYEPSKAAAPAYQQPAYQSGGCPGGVCPTNRVSAFRLFRRG